MIYNKTFQKIFYTPIIKVKSKRLGEEILKEIEFGKKMSKIIDLGCGDCGITKYISNNAGGLLKISAVDVINTSLFDIKPIIYNGNKLPFKNNYFDFGYTSFTLHHCKNQEEVLKELLRVCKKDVVIIEEIYTNNIQKYITYINDWIANRIESPDVSIPFNFHTNTEWQIIFKKLKVRIMEKRRIYQLPGWFHTIGVLYKIRKNGQTN